ncbi:MAG: hypothetical protein ISS77_04470 [Phycisphaerae bacterium]|nr:hypothetical protein [Phycisphaerae bacterium]
MNKAQNQSSRDERADSRAKSAVAVILQLQTADIEHVQPSACKIIAVTVIARLVTANV